MFKVLKRWIFWWKRSKRAKKEIQKHIEICRKMGPAEPPTLKEVEAFKKDFDMGWDSQMVQPIKNKRSYFEASLN